MDCTGKTSPERNAAREALQSRMNQLRHVDSLNESRSSLVADKQASPPKHRHSKVRHKPDEPRPSNGGYPLIYEARSVDIETTELDLPQLVVTGPRSCATQLSGQNCLGCGECKGRKASSSLTLLPGFAPPSYHCCSASGVGLDSSRPASHCSEADKRRLSIVTDEVRVEACLHAMAASDSAAKPSSSNYLKEQIISFFQPSDNKLGALTAAFRLSAAVSDDCKIETIASSAAI